MAEVNRHSNHHPQIRVILFHRDLLNDGAEIDPHRLSLETGKPVITLGLRPPRKTARRILKITSRTGVYSEVLRVAGLLAEAFKPN